jgi:quinol monooxygenase YgiN
MARYGLNGRINAHPGKGDELAANLLGAAERLEDMEGCELYVISRVLGEPDAVVVTEVWDSRESHQASLEREDVKEVIQRSMPLIAGLTDRVELEPVGGKGLNAG